MDPTKIILDLDLIKKYESVRSPYYTTYPTGGEWHFNFTDEYYSNALLETCSKKQPMALYVHIPFCKQLCYFCFCYTRITSDRERINHYVKYLYKEIDHFSNFFEKNGITPDVKQIQLGGGTPTYLDKKEFDGMIERLETFIDLKHLDEFAMEIDPRTIVRDDLPYYYDKGINRISLGIQDFDPKVQEAINRIQPYEMVEKLLDPEVRKCSVNFDLIYGLPFQTRETFRNTIELAKQLSADRLSIYNYDHTPDLHKHQRLLNEADLPSLSEKTMMYIDAVQNLLDNGYEWIGIDHFAKTGDRLAEAARTRTLGRTLNGYSTGRNYNVELALGPSSIGSFGRYYAQNIKEFEDYYKAVEQGKFPVMRGCKLTDDDLIRRDVILGIVCNAFLNFAEIEKKYNINFKEYFKDDLKLLDGFAQDGMMELTDNSFTVNPIGRVFVHHISKVFDKYLDQEGKIYVRTYDAIRFHREKMKKTNLLTGIDTSPIY